MKLEATDRSPLVEFDDVHGDLVIRGRSVHENAEAFYSPVHDSIEAFLARNPARMNAVFDLEYFNSSSSKYFLDILRSLEDAAGRGTAVQVSWMYDSEDLDMKEAGADYKELLRIPLKLKAK
jgi:hypothetical protein